MSQPEISAIVVVGERRERVEACRAALLAEADTVRLEVVLVDLAAGRPCVPLADHPAVRVLALPADTSWAAARAAALRAARARVVAFLEERVRVRPGWAAAVRAAHRGPWAGGRRRRRQRQPGLGAQRRHLPPLLRAVPRPAGGRRGGADPRQQLDLQARPAPRLRRPPERDHPGQRRARVLQLPPLLRPAAGARARLVAPAPDWLDRLAVVRHHHLQTSASLAGESAAYARRLRRRLAGTGETAPPRS